MVFLKKIIDRFQGKKEYSRKSTRIYMYILCQSWNLLISSKLKWTYFTDRNDIILIRFEIFIFWFFRCATLNFEWTLKMLYNLYAYTIRCSLNSWTYIFMRKYSHFIIIDIGLIGHFIANTTHLQIKSKKFDVFDDFVVDND